LCCALRSRRSNRNSTRPLVFFCVGRVPFEQLAAEGFPPFEQLAAEGFPPFEQLAAEGFPPFEQLAAEGFPPFEKIFSAHPGTLQFFFGLPKNSFLFFFTATRVKMGLSKTTSPGPAGPHDKRKHRVSARGSEKSVSRSVSKSARAAAKAAKEAAKAAILADLPVVEVPEEWHKTSITIFNPLRIFNEVDDYLLSKIKVGQADPFGALSEVAKAVGQVHVAVAAATNPKMVANLLGGLQTKYENSIVGLTERGSSADFLEKKVRALNVVRTAQAAYAKMGRIEDDE
jgi:hypothetical protein